MTWVAGLHPTYTLFFNLPAGTITPGTVTTDMRFLLKNCLVTAFLKQPDRLALKQRELISEVRFDINSKWNKQDNIKPATSFTVTTLQNGSKVVTVRNASAEIFFSEWGNWRWRVIGTVVITMPKPGTSGFGKISLSSLNTYCAVNTYSQCVSYTALTRKNWPNPLSALGNIIEAKVRFNVTCNGRC